jgi:hypothetical protein
MAKKTLYEACIELQLETDHYESDLYIKDSEQARTLLIEYNEPIKPFLSQADGLMWLDVAFGYLPFWEENIKQCILRQEKQDSTCV